MNKPQSKTLHIRFHNPNTNEETTKVLIKLIGSSIASQATKTL